MLTDLGLEIWLLNGEMVVDDLIWTQEKLDVQRQKAVLYVYEAVHKLQGPKLG